MKKLWKIALAVTAVAMAFALVGCGGGEENNNPVDEGLTLAKVRSAYKSVAQATEIKENIEITSGSLLQYSEEREYTLSGNVYTVTGTTHTINSLSASTPYTDADIEEYTVDKAEAFAGALALEDVNVESTTVSESVLTVSVKAGREKDFFKSETLADVSGMQAAFTLEGEKLGEITVAYTSGTSSVVVTVSFTY